MKIFPVWNLEIYDKIFRLSIIWVTILLFSALIQWSYVYDKLHPAPSQAAIDKVYVDNNEYEAQQAKIMMNVANALAAGVFAGAVKYQTLNQVLNQTNSANSK